MGGKKTGFCWVYIFFLTNISIAVFYVVCYQACVMHLLNISVMKPGFRLATFLDLVGNSIRFNALLVFKILAACFSSISEIGLEFSPAVHDVPFLCRCVGNRSLTIFSILFGLLVLID